MRIIPTSTKLSSCIICSVSLDKEELYSYCNIDFCEGCAKSVGLNFCDCCGDLHDKTHLYEFGNDTWCRGCAEGWGWAMCKGCNEWLGPYDQRTGADQHTYCDPCFYDSFDHCSSCGRVGYIDNFIIRNDASWCGDCLPDEDNFTPAGFRNRSGCTTKTGSERCYGLELETNECDGYNNLRGHGAWGAKNDPSCSGKELYSAVLDGDEGLKAIVDFAALAKKNKWGVGPNCGYHLHIDMRQEDDDSLFAVAYAYRRTKMLWHCFVGSGRCDNTYCHASEWSCADLENYDDGSFMRFILNVTSDRYEWVNFRAYARQKTFEVRLHHASLDKNEICNWVKAHTRFVDWAATLGYDEVRETLEGKGLTEQFDIISREAWQDEALCSYYGRKAGFSFIWFDKRGLRAII